MKAMNILLMSPTFFPVRGGTEQVLAEIAKRLAKKNGVTLITPWLKGANDTRYEKELSTHIIRIPSINITGLNVVIPQFALLFYLPYFFLKQRLSGKKIDVVHLFHIYNLGGIVALWEKIMRFPLVISLTGWDTYDPVKPLPKAINPYLAWVMNSADAVTTMCTHMKKSAEAQGCRKEIALIPHGTTMPELKEKKGFDLRKKYGIEQDRKIVFSLQRLFPRKGMEYLIRAIPLVIQKNSNVTFVIGGKGPEKERLETLSRELGVETHIVFAGFIPDDELKNYYAAANLFALPSLYEGFGVVYVDALSCGVPVVTTRCGGPEDIITHDNGILVPIRDEQAFADALICALEKQWDKKKISKSAQQYDWKKIVEQYQEIYQKGCGGQGIR
ncbi:MAG: glycosyltransferase family 4 protein [Candidatus Woesearchaeota archaeon]|nr:glycosyltransferase family 4 protein [Candidatus Woesearchaeota archaeon]